MSNIKHRSFADQRVISAEHLTLVLVALRARRLNPDLAKFAAVSNGGATTNRCTERHARSSTPHSCWRTPPVMYPLLPSVPVRLIERMRMQPDGLNEIRRTFGRGYKAMLTEVGGRSWKS